MDFLLCPRDGTPLELEGGQGDPLLGRVLDNTYQVLRLVGEGGMGRVYEARHLRLRDRRLAVKVLLPELARDSEIVARFQREAESASSIGHPNVVEVYDVSKTPDGTPYMVAELLAGEELGARIERVGKLEVGFAVQIARQVCRALAAAHAQGIVHRDMKPDNVFLLEKAGELSVKVIDFGISKVDRRDNSLTRTGMVMGTPSYMAPEQARGEKVDLRIDIYAVGAMLYHALTGKKPFDSEDPTSTLTLVLTEDPERPRSLNDKIPEELELVIQKAMAKDPRDRFASMAELDAALAPFDGGPIALGGAGAHTMVRRDGGNVAVAPVALASDPNARTMVASQSGSTSLPTVIGGSGEAKYARPTIVLSTIALVIIVLSATFDAIVGAVRFFRGTDRLTSFELMLIGAGVAAALATPIVLFLRQVARVWKNSLKTLELAIDMRRALVGGLVTYGVASLGLRIASVSVDAQWVGYKNNGLLDAGLVLAAALVSVALGGFGPLVRAIRRHKQR
jgi:serine/threonine-protein kinase